MTRNSTVIGTVLAIGVSGFAFTAALRDPIEAALGGADAYVIVLQFFLFVVLGGGISIASQQFMRSKEQNEGEKGTLMRMYDELLSAYNKAKRARRLLRARVLTAPTDDTPPAMTTVLARDYDEQMETLIEAHLEFESLERRIENTEGLFRAGDFEDLSKALETIGEYLRGTVEEFEDQRTEFTGEPEHATLGQLPVLARFIGTYGVGIEYWLEFKTPFRTALRTLREEIRRR